MYVRVSAFVCANARCSFDECMLVCMHVCVCIYALHSDNDKANLFKSWICCVWVRVCASEHRKEKRNVDFASMTEYQEKKQKKCEQWRSECANGSRFDLSHLDFACKRIIRIQFTGRVSNSIEYIWTIARIHSPTKGRRKKKKHVALLFRRQNEDVKYYFSALWSVASALPTGVYWDKRRVCDAWCKHSVRTHTHTHLQIKSN